MLYYTPGTVPSKNVPTVPLDNTTSDTEVLAVSLLCSHQCLTFDVTVMVVHHTIELYQIKQSSHELCIVYLVL
jgi:hypothetical protein